MEPRMYQVRATENQKTIEIRGQGGFVVAKMRTRRRTKAGHLCDAILKRNSANEFGLRLQALRLPNYILLRAQSSV
ncbi:hypothetical protein C5167_014157 [Papaver somniferum]|uniref:Uncharacterized protein n=1 Tax=Papaver somniferum TaxID=3469 RepID=A0A4Y7J5S5_PAPSO|nr:hypothetical protein C5167_014157 [Papaver somniferum]